jgi:hypothetical protein
MRLGERRFGVSWQIVPRQLIRLIGDVDRARAKRAFEAMMQMKRIDILRMCAVPMSTAVSLTPMTSHGDYDLRSNEAGLAVSGEITLHADRLYVQVSQSAMGYDAMEPLVDFSLDVWGEVPCPLKADLCRPGAGMVELSGDTGGLLDRGRPRGT